MKSDPVSLPAPRALVSDTRLRIAFFTETFLPRIDGTVTRLCNTVRQLRKMGHEVLVIAPDGGIGSFEGARVYGIPGFPFLLYPELKLAVPRPSIGKALTEFQPDIIQALHPVLLGTSAFHYSSKLRVPLVVSYHAQLPKWLHYYGLGHLEPLAWWGIKAAYNRADLVLATSQVMQKDLTARGVQRVELWRRGVDTQLFAPERASLEMRARLTQGHPEDQLLLFVGRLSAEKDIEQCRPVLAGLPGTRLALVGDGPHRSKLEHHFAGTPTYFAGYMRGEELASAYASSDVFFMPSPTETLGLVVMEAMAAGCPVVAVAEGGIVDILREGVTGHLFAHHDREGAIVAIRRLLDDPAHSTEVRLRARDDAERWSWSGATNQLEGYYRGVLDRDRILAREISDHVAPNASTQEICEELQISRATLRRHMRAGAAPAPNYLSQ